MDNHIGNRIKSARKSKGFTQKKLAEIAKISEISIRKYENGEREPKYDTVEKIAKALNIPIFDLLDLDDNLLQNYFCGPGQLTDTNQNISYLKEWEKSINETTDLQLDSLSLFVKTVIKEVKEVPIDDVNKLSLFVASWLREYVEMAVRSKIKDLIDQTYEKNTDKD